MITRSWMLIAGGLLITLSCGPASPPPQTVSAPASAPASTHDVALVYSKELLDNGVPLPSPLVHGTIAGHPTLIIVDTGAHISMIATWLAREAGLALGESFNGRDGAGRPVPMLRADHPSIAIDGWGAVPDAATAVGDLPATFRRIGVGAIISPQALATANDVVVLDLVDSRMSLVPRDRAPSRDVAAPAFRLREARMCTYDAAPLTARSLIARFTVDGAEVLLDLDTGTNGYMIASGTEVGKRLAARAEAGPMHGIGAAGEFDAVRADHVTIRLTREVDTTANVAVVSGATNPACRAAGRVGMDLLRGCVLVLGQTALQTSCHAVSVAVPISTGNPACDTCMHASCQTQVATCETKSDQCNAFSKCAQKCGDNRACFDDCTKVDPDGYAFNRCLKEHCPKECGW